MRPRLVAAAAVVAAAWTLAPAAARAHDFWVEPTGEGFAFRYGHRGGESMALDRTKVKAIRCVEKAGATRDVLAAARFAPREVAVTARCEAIAAFYHGGFYSLTPDGEVNLARNQARDVVKAWESRQFAKWVATGSAVAAEPLGDELEIVPPADLAGRRVGDKVTFRVLSQGHPVAGAVVAVNHRPLGETDSAGQIRIRLRGPDVESISASLRRPVKTAEADALVLEASLTFEVAR